MANFFSIFNVNVKKDLTKEQTKNENNIETNFVDNDELDDLEFEEVNNETSDLRNIVNNIETNDLGNMLSGPVRPILKVSVAICYL